MKKTIVSLFCVLALCLGLLPTAALAAGESDLYVSGQLITESGCYENQDGTWTKVDGAEPASGQFYYDTSTATLTLNNVSIVGGAFDGTTLGAGICAKTKNEQALSVTINLIGTNTVSGSYGIYVSGDGDSDLIITGSGSLSAEGTGNGYGVGIQVSSSIGYANLTINGVDVSTANGSDRGIYFRSGTNNSNAALTVNGGKLTVSADYGITYQIGSNAGGGIPSLTVTDNAVVDVQTGGFSINSTAAFQVGAGGENTGGIVWNGSNGTVYGNVTLQNDLTVGAGETLTIPEGASLDTNGKTITVQSGGNLEGKPTGSGTVVYAPTITTQPAGQEVTVGQTATFTVAATGTSPTYQWQYSTDGGATWTNIPGATSNSCTTDTTALDMNGYQYQCVVSNTAGTVTSVAATLTVQSIPVASVTLNKNTLSLVVDDTETLTATVEPKNATDQTLTWSSDKPEIAKVENGVVTAVASGTATITATANGGSGISATCEVTVEPKTYTIQVAPAELTFDAVQVGYTQPAAQTVTITNTGNQQVTVKLPIATNFDIAAGKGFENGSATIEPNGTATFTVQPKAGLAVGQYAEELTVSNQNAGEVKLTLTFKVNPVLVSGLTLNQNTLALFAGDSATLTAAVTPENATNKTLTWSSSNTAVATVDQSGKVTAVAPGTAAITVTTNDGSGKVASCPVTVTAKTYALTIDPAAIGFGTVQPGYTQPAAREITVRNTGNQTLTLTQPTATKYLVGSLSRLTLAPGETATFTVQPKADQPVAVYNETILVVGNGGAGASLNLSFTVEKASGTSSGGASSSSSATTTTEKRTLHFDTNGGLPLDDVVRGLGAPVELWPYTPVRAGYLFQGWYADQALTRAVSSVVLTKDTTIYAKWAVDPAATAAPSGSGSGTGSSGSSGKGSGSQGGTTITVTPAPTASPTPTPEPTATPTPEPTATPEASAEPETDTDTASFPVVPVAAGVIVLVVLVGGIVLYRRFHD